MKTKAIRRQDQLWQLLSEAGTMKISDLAAQLQVSDETIRKDLQVLQERGLAEKTHGHARIISEHIWLPVNMKITDHALDKQQIAGRALQFVKDGSVIWLDPGSTVLALVPLLAAKKDLTIITNSLSAAQALSQTKHTLILTGGRLDSKGQSLTGTTAVESLRPFSLDAAFFGSDGFAHTDGPTTFSFDEVLIKHEVLRHARQRILLADGSKFGSSGTFCYADFSELTALITTRMSPEQRKKVAGVPRIIEAGTEKN